MIRAARRGESAAFDELYRRHRQWVWSLAWRFLSRADQAEDVLQDTFLHLWSRFPGFELRARLRTYLYPVVRHLAIDRLRLARRDEPDGSEVSEPAHEPEILLPETLRQDLADALRALPAGQREVLLMRFVDDLELAEIAGALELPLGTVKSRLHHALASLREAPGTREAFS